MRGKSKYQSKKIIIISIIAIFLFAMATLGSYLFIKGSTEAEATELDNMTEQDRLPVAGNDAEENIITDNNQEQAENNNDTQTVNNEQTTTSNYNEGNAGSEQTTDNTNNQTSANVGTSTSTVVSTATPNTEYVATRTETVETVVEEKIIGFSSIIMPNAIGLKSSIIDLPEIETIINPVIESELNGLVKGEKIKYEISVKNNKDENLADINVSAILPTGTELEEGSITENGSMTDSKISWKVNINSNETKIVSFTVVVTGDEDAAVLNTVVNGKDVDAVTTPVIKTQIVADKAEAEKDDEITYTITVANNSEVAGSAKIVAEIPEKTELVENQDLTQDGNKISWNVELAAGETKNITFKVKVTEKVLAHEIICKVNGNEENTKTVIVDKTAPTLAVSYNVEELTNGDVVATITANEEIQLPEGWAYVDEATKLEITKTYRDNKTETITIKDITGNESTVEVKVENIDKTAPEGTASYSVDQTKLTNEDVKVTITANEAIQLPEGWAYVDEATKLAITKTYAENKEETVTIKDIVGNENTVEVKVTNIERILPEVTEVKQEYEAKGKGRIKVTVKFSEPVKNVTAGNERVYVVSDTECVIYRGSYSKTIKFEFEDLAGNKNSKDIYVDFSAPEVTVNYEAPQTELTNEDVVVTITANEAIQLPEGWAYVDEAIKLAITKTYAENKTETVTVKDLVGNPTPVEVKVTNIDKNPPEVTEVKQEYEAKGKGRIKVTVKFSEPVKNVTAGNERVYVVSDTECVIYRGSYSKTIKFEFEDLAGNKNSKDIYVDFSAPEVTVNYEAPQTELTNEDVVVTITANEAIQLPEGWAYVDEATKLAVTKTYAENKEETVTIKDMVGNPTPVEVKVANIDRNPPEVAEVIQEYEAKGKGRIKVTVKFSEPVKNVTGMNDIRKVSDTEYYSYIFRTKTITLNFEDLAGNKNSKEINVDATAPTATVSYKAPQTELTNEDVVVTITGNEAIQLPEGWAYVDENTKLEITKTYAENKEETVTIKDMVGNPTVVEVKVTNIDKILPEVTEVIQVYEAKGKGRIKVTVKFSEPVKNVTAEKEKVYVTSETEYYFYRFDYSTTITVKFEDLAGNKNSKDIYVDLTKPEVTVNYEAPQTELTNKDVKVTITANEAIQLPEGWAYVDETTKLAITKTYTENKTETVTIKDMVGNPKAVEVKVTNIDKNPPEVTEVIQVYEAKQNGRIKVTVKFNEAVKKPTGINDMRKTSDTEYWGYVYKTETVTLKFEDIAGNKNSKEISVDKTKPEVTEVIQVYEAKQNGRIKVTVKFSEPVSKPTGINDMRWVSDTEYWGYVYQTETVTLKFKDLVGNPNSKEIKVDETAPEAKLSYNVDQTKLTNGDVVATITANEAIQLLEGWAYVDEATKLAITKTYTENKTENITIKDLVGNPTPVEVKVENIDKKKAEVGVNYQKGTNGVFVNLVSNEPIQEIDGWTKKSDTEYEKSYPLNWPETDIIVKDLAGNETTVKVNVNQ